jgi:hypothetical protein
MGAYGSTLKNNTGNNSVKQTNSVKLNNTGNNSVKQNKTYRNIKNVKLNK